MAKYDTRYTLKSVGHAFTKPLYWKGIDFDRGGYTEKSFMMDSVLEYEQPYSEMEKFILDGYKNNKVIYPNLVNFSFLQSVNYL